MEDKIYCSVDLEFTGFDPSKDQILELGFAFFRMTDQGAHIIEEWSQVFKPSIEVHPKILGLTGITLEELDNAPRFDEHREFIQSKLRDAIIVAHNPMMDVKFLESYGIKLSGEVIDTLELVQFLLPTHHSYNLENLMHYFGIAHTEAHRALGDCRSTISVLEILLRIYNSFNQSLKTEIQQLASRGNFDWQPLLSIALSPWTEAGNDSLSHSFDNLKPLPLSERQITIDKEIVNHEARVALGLKDTNSLLVVNDNQLVMKLWKAGFVHGLFNAQDVFDPNSYAVFKKRIQTNEELRFSMKVEVWLAINWQTEVVLDLNISFFGGQFKSFIVGGKQTVDDEKIICCDYRTLRFVKKELNNRNLVICNLQDYEAFVSNSGPTYLSWNGLLYILRTIYNPENEYGNEKAKEKVMEALASTDLYFALVYLLLHRAYPQNPHVSMPEVLHDQPQAALRLQRAAENLNDKIKAVLEVSPVPELQQHADFLDQYFQDKPGYIRWVTIDEQNPVFHDQPLDVATVAQKVLSNFSSVKFTETITQRDLLFYCAERLGLNTEATDFADNSLNLGTGSLSIVDEEPGEAEVVEEITNAKKPVVVILKELTEVKSLYNNNYLEFKKLGNLFAQGYSGGGNKMFRNFSIKKESILLATAEFIGRQPNTLVTGTVLMIEPPHIDATHPYIAALLQHWTEKFPQLESILKMGLIAAAIKRLSGGTGLELKIFGANRDQDLKKLLS